MAGPIRIPTDAQILLKGQNPADVMEQVRILLSNQECWCQGVIAVSTLEHSREDPYRDVCKPTYVGAQRWSLLGAVALQCEFGIVPIKLIQYLDHKAEEVGFENVDELNDYVDHNGIVEFIDGVIKELREA